MGCCVCEGVIREELDDRRAKPQAGAHAQQQNPWQTALYATVGPPTPLFHRTTIVAGCWLLLLLSVCFARRTTAAARATDADHYTRDRTRIIVQHA